MKFIRIRYLRKHEGKRQADIAKVLGISQQYYSEYEKGNKTITISHLMTLARYYNTSIDYMVGLSNEKQIGKSNIEKGAYIIQGGKEGVTKK